MVVSLVDQATLAVTLFIAYRYQNIGGFYRHFELIKAKELLKNSWPIIVAGFVLMIQARIDQVMLKEIVGNVELGYYSSAMRLIEVFGFIPMIITSSLFPAIVNAKKISIELYKKRLSYLYRVMMFLFIIVAVPIYLVGDEIIILLFGEAFSPAGQIFSLMALRLLFANYGVARGAYLMADNLIAYSMFTMIIGATVNIALNYAWIPSYQSTGAIYASIVSFFVTIFLIDIIYSRTRANCMMMIKSMFLVNFKKW